MELEGHLRRCLALLRGCDDPATRVQLEPMVSGLERHLAQQRNAVGAAARPATQAGSEAPATRRLGPRDCGIYAIQCEWLASLATDPERRGWLLALARLWRALAQ